jgi:peptidoglycan hydrolase CwlO-like protein
MGHEFTTLEIVAVITVCITVLTLLGTLLTVSWRVSAAVTRMEEADKRHDAQLQKIEAAVEKIAKIDTIEAKVEQLTVWYRELINKSNSTDQFKAVTKEQIQAVRERIQEGRGSSPDIVHSPYETRQKPKKGDQ